jgi:hypothetical protein
MWSAVDIQTDLDAASRLRFNAVVMHDEGKTPVHEASEAKLFTTDRERGPGVLADIESGPMC